LPRRYRYWLELQLAERGPRLAVVLKNPSTATAARSDPTIGKVSAWARRRGFGAVIVVNLFAFRATEPTDLNGHTYSRLVGPENDACLRKAARGAEVLVAAWGNPNGVRRERYDQRIAEVVRLIGARRLKQVGALTAQGYPRHGLWWTRAMTLEPFDISGRGDKLTPISTL
jgi:hypothetical protein